MRTEVTIGLSVAVLLLANVCFAGGTIPDGKIAEITVNKNGNAYVWFNPPSTSTGYPTCVTAGWQRAAMTFTVTTDVGRTIYSALMAAFVSQKNVTATGTGYCTIITYIEDLDHFTIER